MNIIKSKFDKFGVSQVDNLRNIKSFDSLYPMLTELDKESIQSNTEFWDASKTIHSFTEGEGRGQVHYDIETDGKTFILVADFWSPCDGEKKYFSIDAGMIKYVTDVRIITEFEDDCRYYDIEFYHGNTLLEAVSYYDRHVMKEHLKPYEDKLTIKAENFTYYL